MKIAVTGATGFVGRHVIAELAKRADVAVIATARGADRPAGMSRSIGYVPLDIASPPAEAFDRLGQPDTLIHLAWGGLPDYHSLKHFERELPAQYRFLRQLLCAGLGKVVVTGTCFEYGMQSGALHEDMQVQPSNPYGFSKDVLRRQLEFLQGTHSFQFTWARLFYLWGDGQAINSIYPQLKLAAEQGDALFNMSGGEQLRDYLQVEEAVRRLVRLAVDIPGAGVVNVCSGQPTSVRRLVERWIAENGWSIRPSLGRYPYPDYEPLAFWGDIRKQDRLFGTP